VFICDYASVFINIDLWLINNNKTQVLSNQLRISISHNKDKIKLYVFYQNYSKSYVVVQNIVNINVMKRSFLVYHIL